MFAAGSLLAAACHTPAQLIAMRAVMGAGAALIMPATLGIVRTLFTDPAERARAIAVWTGVSGLGVAIGPTTAGWLLEHFAWNAVFLVNLPVAAVALAAGRVLIPRSRAEIAPPLDLAGALLSVAGLLVLTWAIIMAPRYGWLSPVTLAAAAGGVALLVAFGAWEARVAHPMLRLGLFKDMRFSLATLSVAVVFFVLFGTMFVVTQILQTVLGYSAFEAGLALLPMAFTLAVASVLAVHASLRLGTRAPVAAGLVVMAAALGLIATAPSDAGWTLYVVATVILAAGMGCAMAPASDAVMTALPPAEASVGSAVNGTARELGGALGTAVVGSIVASAYAASLSGALAGLGPHERALAEEAPAGAALVAARIGGAEGRDLTAIANDAFLSAVHHGMAVAAAIALLGALLVWRRLPARAPVTAPRHLMVAGAAPSTPRIPSA